MPGILGIIGRGPGDGSKSALSLMLKCMLHETFYSSGFYLNDRLSIAIAWVGHKGSFSDCLPAWNETKDICLMFSGENFADPAEIEALKAKGHCFDTNNADYLVHLYEEYGAGFIEKLNGWFSGVVVDLRQEKIILFNDRYGLKRIYLHENADGFFFSSEAKSLLNVLPALRRLDSQGLAEWFSCGCVLQNRTLYSGVSLLPGASRWTFSRGQPVSKGCYFKPEQWENQDRLSTDHYYGKLKETFLRVLPKYFRGEHPLGMSLTGGLDSRMILAWAGRAPGTLPCYTFGGTYRDCTDVKVARRLAQACQQPHQVISVSDKFLVQFAAFAEKAVYVSDGAMDVAGSVELYVNQLAREIAPIRLTGNYGSEILRGSIAFKPGAQQNDFLEPEFGRLVHEAGRTYTHEVCGNSLSFIAFKQVPWYHYSRLSIEQSQMTVRSPYLDNDLVRLAYQSPHESTRSKEPCLRLIADGNPALSRIPTDRGLTNSSLPVVASARRLLEAFTVKAEYAYDVGMPQWLAGLDRSFASLHLERLFLGRHKFYHFRVWYRDQLSQYLKEVLLDPRTQSRTHLRGGCLETLVKDHVNGHRNYTSVLHQVLTVELIHRQLLERN